MTRSEIQWHETDERCQAKMDATLAASQLTEDERNILKTYVYEELAGCTMPRQLVSMQHIITLNRKYGFKNWEFFSDAEYKRVQGNIKQGIVPEEYRFKTVNGEKIPVTVSETYKQDLSLSLRKFCLWLINKGISHMTVEINKVKAHRSKVIPRESKPVMTAEQIDAVIAAEGNIKYRVYYNLLKSGARPSEIAALRKSDLQLYEEEGKSPVYILKIKQFKGGAAMRETYVFDEIDLIKVYLQTIKEGAYLFESNKSKGGVLSYDAIASRWAKDCEKAGVVGYTLYDVRHAVVTGLFLSGRNHKAICKSIWGGQGDSSMASRYTHLTSKNCIDALRPE